MTITYKVIKTEAELISLFFVIGAIIIKAIKIFATSNKNLPKASIVLLFTT